MLSASKPDRVFSYLIARSDKDKFSFSANLNISFTEVNGRFKLKPDVTGKTGDTSENLVICFSRPGISENFKFRGSPVFISTNNLLFLLLIILETTLKGLILIFLLSSLNFSSGRF